LKWQVSKLEFHKILQGLLKNSFTIILFSSTSKNGQKMAQWQNHVISWKPFKKAKFDLFVLSKGQMVTMTVSYFDGSP